jgi:cell wall-associated NlpC family hydrolase
VGRAGVSLGGLGLLTAGGVLAWSGVNDPAGGPIAAVRDLLSGKLPTPGVQVSTAPTGIGADLGKAAAGAAGAGAPRLGGQLQAAGAASQVIAVATSYLGVPYVWAGASRNGIDCSGLVLVAYRDGAGISLPHLATAQMARGRRVPIDQVQPGDLIGWGVPGNYPHIALAVSGDRVIVAPHTGAVVRYEALYEKKVPGFGYPDAVRIL